MTAAPPSLTNKRLPFRSLFGMMDYMKPFDPTYNVKTA